MRQLTLRVPDELTKLLKARADERHESVNRYATAVLAAAVDPDLAGAEVERLRERLAAAGLLAETIAAGHRTRPPEEGLRAARAAAGRGSSLADFVKEGRR